MASSSNQIVSTPRVTWKYDVFVSFRGEDTRNNFTDHLFGAFHRQSIVAFRDDTNLNKGEHIATELQKAIEESHVFVVVFSRNYASSTWCLRELVKIADFIGVEGKSVLPIFYDVSPSEVRKQSGDFEKAFMEHEKCSRKNLEEVQRWRRALTQVGNISGWDVNDKRQHAEIAKIVKRVTILLGNKTSTLPNDNVAMHSRVEDLENLLILDSGDDVRVVGICGMGGIGKTTVAKALYASISDQFDACCFIDDVSKVYGGHGPIGVQKELLSQTLNEENLQISNQFMASNFIQTRLCQMKCLVVLDNVDQAQQLDKLAMKQECLGIGSRVIVISRDRQILIGYGADEVYQVQPLDHKNALQLFCWNAFKSDNIMSGYSDLTNDVLRYVNGHPLAIKVLGSFLYGRDVSEWRSTLARLRENPMASIMDVLRISYDGLNETEKEIFLDIACFFDQVEETQLKKILDFRGFYPDIGLSVLKDKSFITCEYRVVSMHDLLKELGKSIVKEKSPKEPREWSRVWAYKDVHNVISANMAAENLEAIVLRCFPGEREKIQAMTTLRAEGLAQMSRLKLLMLWNFNFSGSLNFLSSELGFLLWDKYPFTCLPSNFEPDKLVELFLAHSNIRQLWKGTKSLLNLTHIVLSHSKHFIMMPNFLEIPNLEVLDLEGCIKLVQIDSSIGVLEKLWYLNLKDCNNLVSIPINIFCLSSLKHLNLSGCQKLLFLSDTSQIENLEMFDNKESTTQYNSTSFISKVLTPSFWFSIFQKHEVPVGLSLSFLSRLSCLENLDLSFCNLVQIPDAIGWLHSLERLNLGGNNFVTLPNSIKELSKLRELKLEHCKQLKYLPELPSKIILSGSEDSYGLYIFDCPSLIEMECCHKMAFSWMIKLLQVSIKSSLTLGRINIIIPRTQIPTWFNKQNVGNSISIDPLPNLDDKNFIGVAYCATFVAHDVLTNMDDDSKGCLLFEFNGTVGYMTYITYIHFEKDLITVDLDHLCLIFVPRKDFVDSVTNGSQDISRNKLKFRVMQPLGLHSEVKNIGYHWIFKDDLEQLNPEMMYSGNASVQNMYLTNG